MANLPVLASLALLAACAPVAATGDSAVVTVDAGADAAAPEPVTCLEWLAAQHPTLPVLTPANEAKRTAMRLDLGGFAAVDDTYVGAWFPPAYFSSEDRRILFVLPGTDGRPEFEWSDWHAHLAAQGWGFIGLNYYYAGHPAPDDYSDGATIHSRMEAALDLLDGPCGARSAKVTLMGFSRGSAMTFEVLARDLADRHTLHGVIANAGAWPPGTLPTPYLTALSATGMTGGSMWMYCGTADLALGSPMCPIMESARAWVEDRGGEVVELYENPGAGHHSMYASTEAVAHAVNYVLTR